MMVAMAMRLVMTLMAPMNVLVMTGTLEMDLAVQVGHSVIHRNQNIYHHYFSIIAIMQVKVTF